MVHWPGKGTFLFGGVALTSGYEVALTPDPAIGGNVWKWDGARWSDTGIPLPSEIHGTTGGSGVGAAPLSVAGGYRGSAAYDPVRNIIVWMPGLGGTPRMPGPLEPGYPSTLPSDYTALCYNTYEFNGSAFIVHANAFPRLTPGLFAFGSFANTMVYDKLRQKMVLWPGSNAGNQYQIPLITAWEWNTSTHVWDPVTPPPFPQNPSDAASCFDEGLGRMLTFSTNMFSYHGDGVDPLDAILVTQDPPADTGVFGGAQGLSLVWNSARAASVLKTRSSLWQFTPSATISPPLNIYQHGTWTEIVTGNDPWATLGLTLIRPYASMAYDTDHLATVLFGGEMVPTGTGDVGTVHYATNATFVLYDSQPISASAGYATTTNTVRVILSDEPQHEDSFITGDALNPATWLVTDARGNVYTPIAVTEVSAETFDVMLLNSLADQFTTHTIASSMLLGINGVPIAAPISITFLGCVSENDPLRASPINKYRDRDIRNPTFNAGGLSGTPIIGSDNDYENEDGADLARKCILRRLGTKKDSFKHLKGYGLGVTEKEPMPGGELLKLKAEINGQVAQEPDLKSVDTVLMIDRNGVLTISIDVVLQSTGASVNVSAVVREGNLVEI